MLIKYVTDLTTDMHRDMSMSLFFLTQDEVSKDTRDHVKNKFVFPEFYGSYYISCAPALWEASERFDLKTVSGRPLKEHLRRHGITELGKCDQEIPPRKGTFEYHVKKVERDFWDKKFPVYAQWKDDWFRLYQRQGGVNTLTGFRLEGVFAKNDIINYPIQGSSFHCDLWSIIKLQNWINKNRMKTKIIAEIHDSMLADCPVDEVDDFIAEAKQIIEHDLPEHWKWIIVPMNVEIAASPVNGSWSEKKKVA